MLAHAWEDLEPPSYSGALSLGLCGRTHAVVGPVLACFHDAKDPLQTQTGGFLDDG